MEKDSNLNSRPRMIILVPGFLYIENHDLQRKEQCLTLISGNVECLHSQVRHVRNVWIQSVIPHSARGRDLGLGGNRC